MAFNQVAADAVCALLEEGKSLRAACVEIYAIYDPISGDVRYIGKAKNSLTRFKQHLSSDRKTPLYDWIRSLLRRGLVPKLSVLMSSWDWEASEVEAISQYRSDGFRLLNIADGGNQPFCPRSVRAANGASNAKRLHGDANRKRIWWLKRTFGDALKRGHLSEEIKGKLRYAAIKNPELFGEWSAI